MTDTAPPALDPDRGPPSGDTSTGVDQLRALVDEAQSFAENNLAQRFALVCLGGMLIGFGVTLFLHNHGWLPSAEVACT
jgi:hypothetical protein